MIPVRLCILVASLFLATTLGSAQTQAHPIKNPSLLGNWHGDSICAARESACHDEEAFYHVAGVPGKPGSIAITFSKIVNKKNIQMGTLECAYEAATSTAMCVYPVGTWLLQFKGEEMNGTLTLTDKTLFRRVKLKKEK